MSKPFEDALQFTLRWEGGFVDHPNDPGGATNRGVTTAVYDKWRKSKGLPTQDVRLITDNEVHEIYLGGYWRPPKCDFIVDIEKTPIERVQFDTAVNSGPKRAVVFLQRALNIADDGAFGPMTEAAMQSANITQCLVSYCDTRERFFRWLAENKPGMDVFLNGWLNRLNALRHNVGLPGFERAPKRGAISISARIPDLGMDPVIDLFK